MPVRKSQGSGLATATGGKDETKRKQAKADPFPLTNDERNFLISISSAAGAASPTKGKQPFTEAVGSRNLLGDAWWTETALPQLAAITEKVLRAAEEQYQAQYKEYQARGSGTGSFACGAGTAGTGAGSSSNSRPVDLTVTSPNPGSASGAASLNTSATVAPSGAAAAAVAANVPLPPPAGTPAQFAEENAYLLEQLRQLQQCPFTVERLAEVLTDPYLHHITKDGKLKGDALQAALRRCILVTYPVVVSPEDPSASER